MYGFVTIKAFKSYYIEYKQIDTMLHVMSFEVKI